MATQPDNAFMRRKDRAETRRQRAWEAHRKSVDVLFSNENFFIGMLQVVSGGAVLATLSQADKLFTSGLRCATVAVVPVMIGGLVSALLAGYFKHQYKLWDVRAGHSEHEENDKEKAAKRTGRAECYRDAMRATMLISVAAIVLALVMLAVLIWLYALMPTAVPGVSPS